MSLLTLLLVLAAAPPDSASAAPREGVLVYEGPVDVTAAPSTYGFTTYAKGDTPFVAVDEANLRGSAALDGPVVRTLRLGSALQVLEVASETVLVKDRVDRWYRVRTSGAEPQEGFVLGNVLTPLAATRDLDGDGQEESLAVSFTSDFLVRVRVVEPELAARRKRAVAALDFLLPEAAAGRRGGRARLVPVSAKELGMEPGPRAFGLELCAASCVVHAVTYEAKKGVVGTLSVPPEVRAGVTLYSKPRKLLSIYIPGEDEIPDERITCRIIGKVRGGTHDQKEVLTCVDDGHGKTGPLAQHAVHYLMGFNGFYVPEPGEGFLFYAYERDFSAKAVTWKEPRPEELSYSLEYDAGCGKVKRLGLRPHELEDFLTAWVPRMEGAAFNVIGFHPREVVDRLAPVQVSPPPTHMIRILMDATPVEECPTLGAPVLPDTVPAREGFTVVEWGGVLRDSR